MIEEVLRKTSEMFPLPTATASSLPSVAPVPTVIPGSEPVYEVAGDAGQKTLWVVFVLMLIASAKIVRLTLFKIPDQDLVKEAIHHD